MAIEDAAVLGNLLSRVAHPAQLPVLLQAYEDLRLPRTAETQNQSRLNLTIFHLHDGPEQERRDADMRRAAEVEVRKGLRETRGGEGDGLEGSVNQWADERKSLGTMRTRRRRSGGARLARGSSQSLASASSPLCALQYPLESVSLWLCK